MLELLRPALVATLTALIIYGLSALLRASKAASFSGQGGAIRPERWSAWITIIVGAAMVAAAVSLLLAASGIAWVAMAIPLAALGLFIAGFMAPSATALHSVHWNDIGIEGPSTTFGPTLGVRRTAIPWEQIERTGKTATGYWFVEATDRRRIYWSYLYAGYGLLTEALRHRRPALELPDDMM
jgi:hypothetical protein